MKKILLSIIICSFFAAMGQSQTYQQRVRQNVIAKLRFYFVADPTQAFPADIETLAIDKVAISNNLPITSTLWTDANNAGLKSLLVKILCDPAQGGEFRLQEKINNVLLISNKQVLVFLYADFNNPTFHTSWSGNAPYCQGGTNYVAAHNNASWPCAGHLGNATVAGDIGLGAYFYHSSYTGFPEIEKNGTFIHELTHTQMALSPVIYGPDGNHFLPEMIPSQNSAFDEGIANAFEYRYHLPANNGMTAWFNNNDVLFVEDWSGCSGNQCLQTRLANASVSTKTCPAWISTNVPSGVKCYSIRDIPPDILMHCENTIANILYQNMAQFEHGDLHMIRALNSASGDMASAATKFGPLFKEIVRRGMNFRHSRAAEGVHTHGQFLPLGIMDFYTGYKLDSKTTLGTAIGSPWQSTDTNIEDYYSLSNKRNVLLGFRNGRTDLWDVGQQISRFTDHLNVRLSQRSAAPATGGATSNNE